MTRWKLTIEYDGTPYAGWQRQADGLPSVQAAIEQALFAFCQQELTIHVAGRTDAGVHAAGQVAHVDLDYGTRPLTGRDLAKALNAHLRDQPVVILSADMVPHDFHARFSATNKLYIYRILNRTAPPALDANRVWHVRYPIDISVMQRAARDLLGHHDFTSFRDSACQAKSPIRTLDRLDIERHGEQIFVHAEARSFLHHQVRNMVGTLMEIGLGRRAVDSIPETLAARDRRVAGITAPAAGLSLVRIDYPASLSHV